MKLKREKKLFRAKFLLFVWLSLAIAIFSFQPFAASACSGQIVSGVCFPTGTGLSEQPAATIINNALRWILGIFGALAIIAFAVSGIQYLVSAGNEKSAETAKRHMMYSIIGVVVALSAFVIIQAIDTALNASSTAF